jgi:carbon monoxide dehydrogenase subunit G
LVISVEARTVVNAPVEKVWEFMSDPSTMTQWDPGVLKVEYQPPMRVDSTMMVTAQLIGRRTAKMVITEWEPNRRIGIAGKSAGTKVSAVYTLEPQGNMTRLNRSVEVEVGGLLKLISPYVSYKVNKERSAEIDNIKRIVEAEVKSA